MKTRGHKQTVGKTETRYVRETETENSVETCQCDTGEMLPLWWRPQGKDLQNLNTKCRYCDNPGHLEKVCFKKQRDIGSGKIHYVDVEDDNAESGNDCSYLLHFDYSDVNKITVEPIIVKPKIAGVEIPMEVDTGAAVSIIPKETLDRYLKKYKLLYSDARLITYSGEEIHPVGKIKVTVELNN